MVAIRLQFCRVTEKDNAFGSHYKSYTYSRHARVAKDWKGDYVSSKPFVRLTSCLSDIKKGAEN